MQTEITLTTFYAKGDERRLFRGFAEIAAISKIQGRGHGLIMEIDLRSLSKESLRELIALLYRYGISLSPLRELASSKRFWWLDDKRVLVQKYVLKVNASSGHKAASAMRSHLYTQEKLLLNESEVI